MEQFTRTVVLGEFVIYSLFVVNVKMLILNSTDNLKVNRYLKDQDASSHSVCLSIC